MSIGIDRAAGAFLIFIHLPGQLIRCQHFPAGAVDVDHQRVAPQDIPAGRALADEAGRIYYPLSYLAEKYKNSAAITAHNMNPETGGVMEITGPVSADINTAVVTPATQGIDEAQAKLEVTPMTPITEAPAITDAPVQQTQTARSSTGILIALIAAAAALAAGGFLFWRKREEEM